MTHTTVMQMLTIEEIAKLSTYGPRPGPPPKFTPGEAARLGKVYLLGETVESLARQYTTSSAVVWRWLRRIGVATRSRHDAALRYTGNMVKEDAFDTISESSAYWVGFLMADGCITRNGGGGEPVLRVCLGVKDAAHLEKFRAFLNLKSKVTTRVTMSATPRNPVRRPSPRAEIAVFSRRIAISLARFGMVPNKTARARVVGLELNSHFWRGMVDGDGWLSRSRSNDCQAERWGLGLCGASEMMMSQFSEFVRSVCPWVLASVRREPEVWSVRVTGMRAVRTVADALYGDAIVFLDRKMQLYRELVTATGG